MTDPADGLSEGPGIKPDRYTDGDVNHLLQPTVGIWRWRASRGEDPPSWPEIEQAMERMLQACKAEEKWLAARQRPIVPADGLTEAERLIIGRAHDSGTWNDVLAGIERILRQRAALADP